MAQLSSTPSLDVGFLRYWSPARVMAYGIAFYFVAVITSPLGYATEYVTWAGLVYAFATIGAFFLGCYVGHTVSDHAPELAPKPFQVPLDRYINITLVIATACILARIYDRFILRGFAVEDTFEETRETADASVSLFGYVGGAGFCFGLIALALVWLSSSQSRRPTAFIAACVLSAYPMAEALLQGSRSTVLHTAFIVFFFARSTKAIPWLMRSRLALVLIAIGLLVFFQIIFEIRTLQGGGYDETISEVYRLASTAEYAQPPAWLTDIIIATDGRGFFVDMLKTYTHFEQYLTHSWIVYFANFEGFDEIEGVLGWGRFHLSMIMRFVGLLIGEDLSYNPYNYGMQPGMFSTSLSPLYYDFGALGPFVAALFGFAATRVQAFAIRLPERWLPLHSLLCFACAMTLVDNPLIGGLGAFAIWGSLLYAGLHGAIAALSRNTFFTPTNRAFAG